MNSKETCLILTLELEKWEKKKSPLRISNQKLALTAGLWPKIHTMCEVPQTTSLNKNLKLSQVGSAPRRPAEANANPFWRSTKFQGT